MPASPLYRRAHPAGAAVAEWRAADGATLRSFDWPAAPTGPRQRGSILFQTGRGDIFEKYLELFAHWHARGWAITAFDWRGQGGSARIGRHPLTGHVERFQDFISDLEAFAGEWSSHASGPQVVVGHSMGGHLMLRALVEQRVRPAAAVLVAPMLGLRSPLGQGGGRWLARAMSVWNGDRPAWKANETPLARAGRQELLTFDDSRYADELWWQDTQPRLITGPPSWRWVAEAFASTRALARDPRLATMDVPVLALVAEEDRLVDPAIAKRLLARLPDARIESFGEDSRHEILREADPVRNRAIGLIDAFLAEHAPA